MPNTINASNKLTSAIHATNNTNPSAPKPIVNLEELRKLDDGLAGAQVTLNDLIGVEDKETYCPDDSVLKQQSFALREARKFIEHLRREALNLPMTGAPIVTTKKSEKLELPDQCNIYDLATIAVVNKGKDQTNFNDSVASYVSETLSQLAGQCRLISSLVYERFNSPSNCRVIGDDELLSQTAQSIEALSDSLEYCSDLIWNQFGGGAAN